MKHIWVSTDFLGFFEMKCVLKRHLQFSFYYETKRLGVQGFYIIPIIKILGITVLFCRTSDTKNIWTILDFTYLYVVGEYIQNSPKVQWLEFWMLIGMYLLIYTITLSIVGLQVCFVFHIALSIKERNHIYNDVDLCPHRGMILCGQRLRRLMTLRGHKLIFC